MHVHTQCVSEKMKSCMMLTILWRTYQHICKGSWNITLNKYIMKEILNCFFLPLRVCVCVVYVREWLNLSCEILKLYTFQQDTNLVHLRTVGLRQELLCENFWPCFMWKGVVPQQCEQKIIAGDQKWRKTTFNISRKPQKMSLQAKSTNVSAITLP